MIRRVNERPVLAAKLGPVNVAQVGGNCLLILGPDMSLCPDLASGPVCRKAARQLPITRMEPLEI